MTTVDEPVPLRPRKSTAPGTHTLELHRLALQESMHPDCDPLAVQTLLWLSRAANATVNALADELRPLDLSPSAFGVLVELRSAPSRVLEPCQLSERLLVSRPAVTGLLDTLEAKDLVERRPHAADRRRVLVELTSAGNALLESHFPAYYATVNAQLGELSAEDKSTLVTLLRRVQGAIPDHLGDT